MKTIIAILVAAILTTCSSPARAVTITGFGTAVIVMDGLTLTNDLTIGHDLAVGRNATVTGTFGATGVSTFGNTLGVTGLLTGSAGATIVGQTLLGTLPNVSTFTATGNAAIAGTLGVAGTSTLGGVVYLGTVPKSTFTAAGILQVQSIVDAGAASVEGALTGTSGAFSTTLDVAGNTYLAAGTLYTSTFTVADGKWAAAGFVGPLTGAVTGAASSNVLKAGDTMTGQFVLYARNIGQAVALAPAAVGASIYCSDCVPPKVLIGTGTFAGNWADAVGALLK